MFKVNNKKELKFIGELLASWIITKKKNSFLLLLTGELGSGKTTLINFIAKHLGIKKSVQSASFTIFKQYWISKKNCYLNHFDLFRLRNKKEKLLSLLRELRELMENNLNIIEWAEIFLANKEIISEFEKKVFHLKLSHIPKKNKQRKIELKKLLI